MDQNEAKAKLAAYLDPKLSDDERAVMEKSILADEAVRKELEALQGVDAQVKAAATPQAPDGYFDDLPGRLVNKLEAESKTDSVPASAQGMFASFAVAATVAEPSAEGSGLTDLKRLARKTVSDMDAVAQPSLADLSGPVSRTSVVGLKVESHGGKDVSAGGGKWVWAVVGGVGTLGVVAAYMFTVMNRPEPAGTVALLEPPAATATAPVVAAPPTATTGIAPAPAATEAPKEAKEKEGDSKLAASADRPRAARAGGVASSAKVAVAGGKSESGEVKADPGSAAAAPANDLDALLAQASRGSKGPRVEEDEPVAAKKAVEAPAEGEGSVSLSDLRKAMDALQPKIRQCFKRYQIGGSAEVTVMIAPSGKLQSATLKGEFLGTPTGECVLNQVKAASFPKFKGSPMSLTYPFTLH